MCFFPPWGFPMMHGDFCGIDESDGGCVMYVGKISPLSSKNFKKNFSYLNEMSNFAYKQKACLLEDDEKCSLCCGILGGKGLGCFMLFNYC